MLQYNYMLTVELINWWYIAGWASFIREIFEKLRNTVDFFSIGQLLKTLFAPFRQISANGTSSSALDARFQAFLDRLVSRLVGSVVRIMIIILGIITLVLESILACVLIVIWPFLPILPIFCVIMAVSGVAL